MPKRVHLPDGRIVNFPDAMTPEQIQAAMVTLTGGAKPAESAEAPAPTMAERAMSVGRDALTELAGATPRREGLRFGTLRPDMAAALEGTDVMGSPMTPASAGALRAARAAPEMARRGLGISATRAGQRFQDVMGAAKNVPVDISAPGNVALRIADLAQHGGGTNWGPGPVRQFIQYVTDPKKPPMTYEVARDFASNISKLSVDEMRRMSPAIRREVHKLRVTLNGAVEKAAASVGKGGEYTKAMREYARSARAADFASDVGEQLKKWAIPSGIVIYGARKLSDLVGGE